MLHPPADAYERGLKPNALSCVVRVGTAGRSALLAGDIERDQEAALVAGQAAALRSDVLIAPHHGSRTSSTAAFLDAAQPATAVFQAGYRSRFGHPAPDVVARYRERGIAVVASPACGAWRWPHAGSEPERATEPASARSSVDTGTTPAIPTPHRRVPAPARSRRTREAVAGSAWPELC